METPKNSRHVNGPYRHGRRWRVMVGRGPSVRYRSFGSHEEANEFAADARGLRAGSDAALLHTLRLTQAAVARQRKPRPNGSPAIADRVIADVRARQELGQRRYGTDLQANNGRDALVDAYQEAIDLAMYLRQLIEERETKP